MKLLETTDNGSKSDLDRGESKGFVDASNTG